MKRSICLLLTAILCLTMCGAAVAGEVVEITTAAQFLSIRNNMAANYILKNDIEFTDADYQAGGILENGFLPFGLVKEYDAQKGYYYGVTGFTGTLDGNGHFVTGLRIAQVSSAALQNNYAGLFAENAGTVKNLSLNVDISFLSDENNALNTFLVGGIAARNASGGSIDRCSVSGRLYAKTKATLQIGGIVGENSGTVTDSVNTASVTVGNEQNTMRAGGIAGYTKTDSVIERCFSSAVLLTEKSFGSENLYIGTLIGYNNGAVYHGYTLACIKKILGRDSAKAAQRAKNSMAILSTVQAADTASFVSFDFTDVWTMGASSPELKLFAHTHSFGTPIQTDGNCMLAPSQQRSCSICGQTEWIFSEFEAHDLDTGTVTTAPTCMTPGTVRHTCRLCGQTVNTAVDRLPVFALTLNSTGTSLQPSGSYNLNWQSRLDIANDPGAIDCLVTEYGIIYATSEQTLLTYTERIAAGLDTDDLKVSVRPAVSSYVGITKLYRYTNFLLTGVAPNKERYAVAYIRYELDGEEFEDFSAPAYATTAN